MTDEKKNYVTSEGHEKLIQELNELKNVRRKEIANRIQDAKELGDLSENAEYAEAKNDQAFIEGRIIQLETLLRDITIIDKKPSKSKNKTIEIGSKIVLQSDAGEVTYTIVGSNEADPPQGLISNESPIGQAFIGRKQGDQVKIIVPKGTVVYTVLDIS